LAAAAIPAPSAALCDSQRSGAVSTSNPHRHLDVLVDYAGRTDCQPVYVGYADAGSLTYTSEPLWQIMRCDYDGSTPGRLVQRVWAQLPTEERGNVNFNKQWDLRTTYAYN
jgi:hypothetical protein